jgi:signal transduction histidine kinase
MAAESLEGRVAAPLCQLPEEEASVVRQYLAMIQAESFRCKQITERLLDFSRAREATREMIDLTRLVSEVVAMIQHLTRYREKKIDFSRSEPCYAEVSGSEIKQVVLNLIANGLDAVDRGGTLRIALVEQTDHVRIEFHDDGCGMTTDVLENMFEPFFTRKQNGQGTGLGLSISHRIVSQHGGTISATSPGPGLGSTFLVRLPRRMPQVGAAA